jgi:hypothetical protein
MGFTTNGPKSTVFDMLEYYPDACTHIPPRSEVEYFGP